MLPWVGRISAVLMLALLGWLGADIYWSMNAPESVRPSALMETDLEKAQQAIAGRHLFGVYVVANAPASAPSDIRLNGAIAADKPGQRAYALLSIEGKPSQLVREGEDLAPGITLKRVEARQVELLRGGQTLTLRLPESGKAGAAGAPGTPGTTNPTNPANLPPAPPAGMAAEAPPAVVAAPAVQTVPVPAPQVQPGPLPQDRSSRRRNRRNANDDT